MQKFNAINLSRSDTAYDANYNSLGVGIKTFICPRNSSMEKIAEFNSLAQKLSSYKDKELAVKLAQFRNERIKLANRLYGIEKSIYHIIARKDKKLVLFETNYDCINIDKISNVRGNDSSLKFEDGINYYSFNYSKSTLFRKFTLPYNSVEFPVDIIKNPYDLLLELFTKNYSKTEKRIQKIILPLYGINRRKKFVYEKSGLNQWNAGGRQRNLGEIYIPIPSDIHNKFKNFFPERDKSFNLQIPTSEILSAKVCQDNCKALMTNPNNALSNWLLRKVLNLNEGELATIEKLDTLGFDSVEIIKIDDLNYKIDIMKTDSYAEFSSNYLQ